jgi:hypothetical protein
MNPRLVEVCVFHLGTHDANRKLTVQFDNKLITHVEGYLGITLDRTLSENCQALNEVQERIRYE